LFYEPIVRLYKNNDEKEIIEILKRAFPDWERALSPQAYWRWKYLESPLRSNIFVATINDKIVSVSHDVVIPIKIGDRIMNAFYADDTATHPDYRGRNLHSKITDYKEVVRQKEECKLSYSVSTNPIVIQSAIRRGNRIFPFKKSHMVKINDPSKLKLNNDVSQILRENGIKMFNSTNKIKYLLMPKLKENFDFTITDGKMFDNKINNFWEKVKNNYNFILQKDKNYLNWRYCDSRGGKYEILTAIKNNEIIGFMIILVKRIDEASDGYIMELITLPDRIDAANSLLKYAIELFDKSGVNIIHYLLIKNSPIQKISTMNGFIDATFTSSLQVIHSFKSYDENYKKFLSSKSSQISFSYGDFFQQPP
jgi:hypothetical protein